MPYRVDFRHADNDALDRLVELGALDVESSLDGMAALLPDSVTPEQLATALGAKAITVSHAVGRDAGSVWVLSPRPISIGRLRIVPAHREPAPDTGQIDRRVRLRHGIAPDDGAMSGSTPGDSADRSSGRSARRGNGLWRARLGGADAGCASSAGDRHRRRRAARRRKQRAPQRTRRAFAARARRAGVNRGNVATRARQCPRRSADRDGAGSRSARRPSWSGRALRNSVIR